jgi:hypothetical protein
MNTHLTTRIVAAAALSLAAAGSALAQEATSDNWTQINASQSRAEVAAQASQALRAGHQHEAYQLTLATKTDSGLSRDAVRAETRDALRSGEIARINALTWQPMAAVPTAPLQVSQLGG